jgi:hypothetical protein
LRQSNPNLAAQLQRATDGTPWSPAQVLAAGTARGHSMPVMLRLLQTADRLEMLKSTDPQMSEVRRGALLTMLTMDANQYANELRPSNTLPPVVMVPKGVAQLPPVRPAGYSVAAVPGRTITKALGAFESNSYPVSSPSYERPADPLFATWFKGLSALGTRELTVGEMKALVDSEVSWPRDSLGMRSVGDYRYQPGASSVLGTHDLHKFIGGFRGYAGAGTFSPGMGGEWGLIARLTDEYSDNSYASNVFDRRELTRALRGALVDDIPSTTSWPSVASQLTAATPEQIKETAKSWGDSGLYADPSQEAIVRPMVQRLSSTTANSPDRAAAAKAITQHFAGRARALEQVSISGVTAEIQMLQTISSYVKENNINFGDGSAKLDAVKVYEHYVRLLNAGRLVSRQDVADMFPTSSRVLVP